MTEEDKITIAKALSIPSGYARIRLGLKLHPIQANILDSLFSKPKNKVSVLFGNELGKTTVVGTVAILYALDLRNALIVSTSATYRQIIKQLIPSLKKYAHLYPTWEFLESSIKINGETRYIGFQTADQGRWQGWHGTPERPLFIFTDESAALDENVFQSIGRCNPDYLLVAGSPLGPEGVFYSIEREPNLYKQFEHFKMTKFDALKKDGWWIDETDINDFISAWGKEHPLVLSSVYAEFASIVENGLLSLVELDKCYSYPPKEVSGVKCIGLDFSAGGDANCIAYRNGNTIKIIDYWREKDVMRACDRFAAELNKLKEREGITANMVNADVDGLGIGFYYRLKDLGWSVNEFHGGAQPNNFGQYANKISECWFELVKSIKNCSVILPDNNEFKLQLLSRKQLFNDKGRLKLESKNDMKSRGVSSPDLVDAVAMSVMDPNSGNLTHAHKINIEPRKYSFF